MQAAIGIAKMSSSRRQRSTKRNRGEKNEDEEAIEKEPQGSFAWVLLKPSQIHALRNTESPEELEERMAMTLNFETPDTDLKQACQLDFYVTIFHWGMEKRYDNRQLGGLMTLASNLMKNIGEKNLTRSENVKFVNECLSGIGSENPDIVPIHLYFFTLQNAKDIVCYLFTTFFQHYSLYKFIFNGDQDELIIGSDLSVNVCPVTIGPFPQPLEEALPVEIFDMMAMAKEAEDNVDETADLLRNDELEDGVLNIVRQSDNPALKEVTKEDVKTILEKIRMEMIKPTNTMLKEKIKEKELGYISKISKLQVR